MIPRLMSARLLEALEKYPVVTVLGPRQAGKTTLVKETLPDFSYANLENPEIREFAQSDPKGFLAAYPSPVILDEIQRVPELLSWIQVISDESGLNGRYVLTGNNQPELSQSVSQSLAGRTALLTLLPLSWEELGNAGFKFDRDDAIVSGFLPRVWQNTLPPMRAYLDYFATYVERDVRQLLRVKDLSKFETFIKLLAGRIGQVANLHALGGDVGVSSTTLAEWISVLEASFVIFRLPSYHRNLGKRLVKSPKFFFYEPGLAAALLQIETPEQAGRDPLMGNLFENVVVVELLKGQLNRGLNGTWSYFRDNSGNEVDLIWERQRIPQPIEIKAGRTWTPEWTKRLEWFSALAGEARPSWVVHPGDVRRSGATDPAHCARDILDDL
ncbi:MAG TPA: ATP-binding protein [Treponemataceae bacterium]|nr:ATP-binding protein [Treponemataceae bacterium]